MLLLLHRFDVVVDVGEWFADLNTESRDDRAVAHADSESESTTGDFVDVRRGVRSLDRMVVVDRLYRGEKPDLLRAVGERGAQAERAAEARAGECGKPALVEESGKLEDRPTLGGSRNDRNSGKIVFERHGGTVPDRRYGWGVLRIGMLCPYSLTIPGGVQMQVLGLARELRAMGHEVRVLGPCDGAPPEPFVTPLGNSLPTAANGSVAPLAPDASAALRTIRALNDEDFDVIHLHEPLAPGVTMTALLLRLAPTIGTFHAAGDSASYRMLNRAVRWLASRIDIRVAVSKDAELLANRYLGGEYELLGNGIELGRYGVRDQTQPVVKAAHPTIFFVGRHEPRKGLDVLLGSLAFLPDDVRVWVASDGPDTDALRAKFASESRIVWLGRVSDAEKIRRMTEATVFCAPSLHGESFGVVLLEAMASGTPVVASDIDGYQNVATHDVDALLVEPGDERALAAALAKVMANPRLSQRLIEAGHRRVEASSMRVLAESYVRLYERALEMERSGLGDGYATGFGKRAEDPRRVVRPNRMLTLLDKRRIGRRRPS